MKKLSLSVLVLTALFGFSVYFSAPTYAVPCDQVARTSFFGIPTWYKYLECDDKGVPQIDSGKNAGDENVKIEDVGNGPQDLWLIAAAILEIMLRLASMFAIVYISWAGFTYITSAGAPDKTAQARKQIINASAGLVITIVAGTLVSQVISILRPSGNAAADTATIVRVMQLAYAVGGALAVVMIVVGGLKFVTSNGDPSSITSARNTILYALVGLVIVLLASAITSFTIGSV